MVFKDRKYITLVILSLLFTGTYVGLDYKLNGNTYVLYVQLFLMIAYLAILTILFSKITKQRMQLESILESASDGIFETNKDLLITYKNTAFDKLFQEITPSKLHDVLEDTTHLEELKKSKLINVECFALNKDGNFPIQFKAIAKDELGDLKYLGSIRDLTAQKRIEAHKIQEEKLKTIGHLSANIAHNTNSLLQTALNYLSCIKCDDEAPINKAKEAILQCGEQTSSLLSFVRMDTTREAKLVDLNALTKSICVLSQSMFSTNVKFKTTIPKGQLISSINESKIKMAITNLLVNARDALEDSLTMDKVVHVSLEAIHVHEPIHVYHQTIHKNVPLVKLTISDTGKGIKKELLSKIFDPYFTTKPESQGTGLGLSEVFSTMNEHNGYIDVTSSGQGTIFTLYLKLEMSKHYKIKNGTVKINGNKIRNILLVDDSREVGILLKAQLVKIVGCEVTYVERGKEALDLYKENKYDLVFMDMQMPEMDGFTLFNKLKEHDSKVRLIVITSHDLDIRLQRMLQSGVLAILRKPFMKKDILELIAIDGE